MKIANTALAVTLTLLTFQASAEDGVARSAFTSAIDNREPVDELTTLNTDTDKVYYFTELQGLKGQVISHRWEQNGEVQATVNFNVGGDRWRIWSSKNLQPEFSGEWQVMVVDEAGNVLAQNSFNYGETTTPAAETEPQQAQATESDSLTTDAATQAELTDSTPVVSEEELSRIAPAAGPGKSETAE